MLPITQMLAYKGTKCRPGLSLTPTYITIHNTANSSKGADADNHATYLRNGGSSKSVSYHYCVDDHQIVQIIPDNEVAWHAGDGGSGTGNRKSLAIEICENSDGDILKATNNAVELTAMLMNKYNISIDRVVQHNHWSGKDCPRQIRKGNPYNWDTFKSKVIAIVNGQNNVVAKTYKVVTPINKYSTAADAKSKINAKKDKLAIGTYYIYNKYPNGVNGMYNISTDKTGNSAGSWINPTENVVQTTTQLYRVRKSKDDVKSQVGAYSVLKNAQHACDSAGEGYHVFDKDFNIVYSYKASNPPAPPEVKPEPPKEETKVIEVYDLDYPIKNKIVEKDSVFSNEYIRENCVRAIKAIKVNNENFDVEIAKNYFKFANKYYIDPVMVIAQSILETGWFKFEGSSVKPEQHNYCGLGATGNGASGASFDTIEKGVRAQYQHLYAYGCTDVLPDLEDEIYDPRFKYVTRGIATYWQNLAGRWAVPGYDKTKYSTPEAAMKAENTYGQKIYNIAQELLKVEITDEEVDYYFHNEQEKPNDADNNNNSNVDTDVNIDVDKNNTEEVTNKKNLIEWIVSTLKLIADLILKLFNK